VCRARAFFCESDLLLNCKQSIWCHFVRTLAGVTECCILHPVAPILCFHMLMAVYYPSTAFTDSCDHIGYKGYIKEALSSIIKCNISCHSGRPLMRSISLYCDSSVLCVCWWKVVILHNYLVYYGRYQFCYDLYRLIVLFFNQ